MAHQGAQDSAPCLLTHETLVETEGAESCAPPWVSDVRDKVASIPRTICVLVLVLVLDTHDVRPWCPMIFDHEKLDVYRVSIQVVAWAGELIEGPLADCRQPAVGQLDRASTSIALNIAEGNGKRSVKDRCRYLDIARGSAFESAACLDVLVARGLLTNEDVAAGKALLKRVVGMLTKWTQTLIGDFAPAESRRKAGWR